MAYAYYVYYRVAPSREADCKEAVSQILHATMQATGVVGRLLKKRAEPLLWMEVYENVSDDVSFESGLAQEVVRHRFQDYLQPGTQRRVECFETC